MDPPRQFCQNPDCPDRGQRERGNIGVHSQQEQRYRCLTGERTFAATKGTPLYRLRTAAEGVTIVLKLRRGRPQLVVESELLIGQVVKQYAGRRVISVVHRVVRGTLAAITEVLTKTVTGKVINTAYIFTVRIAA